MRLAYLDTSCPLAITFREPGFEQVAERIRSFDMVFSANLLEAEMRSALTREKLTTAPDFSKVRWIFPSRPMTGEIRRVLEHGYVRGADLWHLACALLLAPEPSEITFL